MVKKSILLLIASFFIFASSSFAGTIQIPQTGQKKCYDLAGTEISCVGTGQDGEIRAGVVWPIPRFMDNVDGTITDNLTGLMWTKDAGTPNIGQCTGGPETWYQALDYVACLNANNYRGHSDWRLPNVSELKSLANGGVADSSVWLQAQGFTNVLPGDSSWHWSSTSVATDGLGAFFVYVNRGEIRGTYKTTGIYVWPVRAGQSNSSDSNYPANIQKTGQTLNYYAGDDGALQKGVTWPDPRFTDNADGTITDNLTGLVWLKDANCFGYQSWDTLFSKIADFNNNPGNYTCNSYSKSYHDWRVPNKVELLSLMDYSNINPSLQADHPFVNVQVCPQWTVQDIHFYWSSSSLFYETRGYPWIVDACAGGVTIDTSNTYYPSSVYLWPVRGGSVSSPVGGLQNVSLDLNNWMKGSCGNWEQTAEGIKAYGDDYRGWNYIESKTIFNLVDKELYIKWMANGGGTFSGFGPWIYGVLDLGEDFSTNNPCCRTYTALIANNTWFYTRIKINADKSWYHVTCTGNYDTNGGTVFSSRSGTIPDDQWQLVDKANIAFRSGDAYAGVKSFFVVGEVKTDATPININPTSVTIYDFADGIIPSAFNIGRNWTIDSTGYNSSSSLYVNTNQTSSISIDVTGPVAVSFKMKSSTTKWVNNAFFSVNGNFKAGKTGTNNVCWNDYTFVLPEAGTKTLTWTYIANNQDQGQVWIDDIKIEKSVGNVGNSLSGAVTYNGSGLNNVTMTLSGNASQTVSTGSDGTYSFTGLANGSYTITPSLNGYKFAPPYRNMTISGGAVAGKDFGASRQIPSRIKIVLVEFSDLSHQDLSHTVDFYKTHIIPDVIKYHYDNSFNQVVLQEPEFLLPAQGEWINLGISMANYSYPGKWENEYQFLDDVIAELQATSDFRLSNLVPYQDILIIIHAGGYAQAPPDSSLVGPLNTMTHYNKDGVAEILLSEYSKLGDWAHEMGHAIGFDKDLYLLGNVGPWDVMAMGNNNRGSQSGNIPPFMSSYTREYLGWLKYDPIPLGYGNHLINSLDTSNLGDSINRYNISDKEYYILEARTKNIYYSQWDTSVPSDALVLYKIQLDDQYKLKTINIPGYPYCISNFTCINLPGDGVLEINGTYRDMSSLVAFTAKSVDSTDIQKYRINVQIDQITQNLGEKYVGLILKAGGNVIDAVTNILNLGFISPEGGYVLPDLDLHLYTDDGRHIGVNYATGEYEVGIPDAIVSGDLYNDTEWIFVPSNVTGVHFVVSSADTQAFLEEFPGALAVTDGKDTYKVFARIIDPQTGIFTSDVVVQDIPAGSSIEHPLSMNGNNIIVGSGVPAVKPQDISVSASIVNFSSVTVKSLASQNVTVSNKGDLYLTINSIFITSNNTGEFNQTNDCVLIAPGGSCTITLDFIPISCGSRNAILNISSNDPDSPSLNVTLSGIGVDVTPPIISISNCALTVNLAASSFVNVTVVDSESGVASQSVSSGINALNTSTVGTKTLTVTAKDYCGNRSSNSCAYKVIYDFLGAGGFQPPVDDPPITNIGKSGTTIPVKWQLPNGHGGFISNLGAVTSIQFQQVACSNLSSTLTDPVETTVTGGTTLRYDFTSNQYIYNWQTSKTWAGKCYTLNLTLNDGMTYKANFSLK